MCQIEYHLRAESLERHSEMEIMLSEVTTVQKSMKTVLHHLEDRLEKVHCSLACLASRGAWKK